MRAIFLFVALLASTEAGFAQPTAPGPGGVPMAPGPSQPHTFTPGGSGTGGAVAPGPAARNVNMDRIGPGGVALAPGGTRRVRTRAASPAPIIAPSSSGLRTTIYVRHRKIFRHKRKPPPHSVSYMR
jgi:hypothetical protein